MGTYSGHHPVGSTPTDGRLWRTALAKVELTPGRIALVYALFGFLALFASDVLLVQYLSGPLLAQVQAAKGGVEVVLSAGLIYVLTGYSRHQVEQIADSHDRQREELQVLHRVLRHNLRNDINVITARTRELAEELPPARREECLAVVQETCDRILGYTEKATKINRVTERNGQVVTTDAVDAVDRVLAANSSLIDGVDCDVTTPESTPVAVNRMFEPALQEAIRNAVVHNERSDPELQIDVRPEAGPAGGVVLEVRDNGPGIDDAQLAVLSTDRLEGQLDHLSGLGLWLVDWTVTSSGGQLDIEDNEMGGTTLRMTLPRPYELPDIIS